MGYRFFPSLNRLPGVARSQFGGRLPIWCDEGQTTRYHHKFYFEGETACRERRKGNYLMLAKGHMHFVTKHDV